MSASSTDPAASAGPAHGRYFDGETGAATSVDLRLDRDCLLIAAPDGPTLARWRREAIVGADELAPDGVALLHAADGEGRVATADPTLLAALRRRRRSEAPWLAAALLLSALVAGVLLFVPVLPSLARLVPEPVQDRFGEAAVAQIVGKAARCEGEAGMAALDALAATFARAAGGVAPPRIEVRDNKHVNAFAVPARRIVVLRGLVARLDDAGEFAGIVGHEFGHVLAADPMTGFLRSEGLTVAGALVGLDSELPATLIGRSYGRAVEARADATSVRLMRAAGMRSDGLARALARIDPETASGGGWLANHPGTAERIAASRGEAAGADALTPAQWEAVRTMCER